MIDLDKHRFTVKEWVMLCNGKPVYVCDYQKPGWLGKLPFYAFKCRKHGIVISYPRGYWKPDKGTIPVDYCGTMAELRCPKCAEEARR